MSTIVESTDLVVVTRYTRGVIGPILGIAGTVKDGGRIRTVTPIVAAFTGGRTAPGSLTADERTMADRLFVQRYAHPAWHATGETPRGGETEHPVSS